MFEFKNKHNTQVQIDGKLSRGHAERYIQKMVEAFAVLSEVEALLSSLPVKRNDDSQTLVTTAKIEGQDFSVRLLFACDSDKPIAAEIIREVD